MKKKLKIWFYRIWYGERFEVGYTYKIISCSVFNLYLLERQWKYWKDEGWERFGEVKNDFMKAYVWIRKRNVTNQLKKM